VYILLSYCCGVFVLETFHYKRDCVELYGFLKSRGKVY